MTKIIMFLMRRKLGVKKGEAFRFVNQKNKEDKYYITDNGLMKIYKKNGITHIRYSNVSLTWLLNHRCAIEKA
jgi:hypothetical protein